MPLSIIKNAEGECYIVVAGGSKDILNTMSISFQHKFFIPALSMHFHDIILNLSINKLDLKEVRKSVITDYILALPELRIDGYMNEQCGCSYYVIDSNWNELDQHMQFNKPKSPECKY